MESSDGSWLLVSWFWLFVVFVVLFVVDGVFELTVEEWDDVEFEVVGDLLASLMRLFQVFAIKAMIPPLLSIVVGPLQLIMSATSIVALKLTRLCSDSSSISFSCLIRVFSSNFLVDFIMSFALI